MRPPKPRPVVYAIYAALISIGFTSVMVAGNQQASGSAMLLILACLLLDWQHFRQSMKRKALRLEELVAVAPRLLFVGAFVLFYVSSGPEVMDEHFWSNRPLLACLWCALLIAPLREILSRSRNTGVQNS